MNFKKVVDTGELDLGEIGWSESRTDEQIIKYVKKYFVDNYERKIDDELALVFVFIIDDVLTRITKSK